jgi:ribonuclease BN (tRNA processing enzyme)
MDTRNFPITYDALKASINFNIFCSGNQMMGIEIITIKLNHPGSGVGFRFTKDKRSLIFLTDHELEDHPYIGASIKETIEFCRNADLLIHDAQYLKEEMPLHRGWGHSAFEDVVEMASEAGIKKLLFFHHDPIRTDAELDKILYEVNDNNSKRNIPLSCFAAREGEELVV